MSENITFGSHYISHYLPQRSDSRGRRGSCSQVFPVELHLLHSATSAPIQLHSETNTDTEYSVTLQQHHTIRLWKALHLWLLVTHTCNCLSIALIFLNVSAMILQSRLCSSLCTSLYWKFTSDCSASTRPKCFITHDTITSSITSGRITSLRTE